MDTRQEINEQTIMKESGTRADLIFGIFFMAFSSGVFLFVLYILIKIRDFSDPSYIRKLIFVVVFLGAVLIGGFGYGVGYRALSAHFFRAKKALSNGQYVIKKDMIKSITYHRDSDNDTVVQLHFRDYDKPYRTNARRNACKGESYFLVFNTKRNELIALMSERDFYLPGQQSQLPPKEVELEGETIVVGEQEALEDKQAKTASKFITIPLVISLVAGIAWAIVTRAPGSAFLLGLFLFNIVLVLEINFGEVFIGKKGKPVYATVVDVKKFDGFKSVVYSFNYKGEDMQVEVMEDGRPHLGKTYSAFYMPKSGNLYVDKDKKGKKANPKNNGSYGLLGVAIVAFIIFAILFFFKI